MGLLLTLLFMGAGTQQAYACSCARGLSDKGPDYVPTVAEVAERYDAVFSGRVLGGGDAPNDGTNDFWTSRQYLFSVDEAWKGVDTTQVYVYSSGTECCICGLSFSLWSSYLVYAYRTSSGKLRTIICDPTKPLAEAAGDIRELGPGKKPSVSVSLPNPAGPIMTLAPVVGGAALAALTLVIIRIEIRRRKRMRNM